MLKIAEVLITILLTYLFWYVQVFGNYVLILYGTTIIAVFCILVHMIMKGDFYYRDYPIGIWINFIMCCYCISTSIFVAYNKEAAIDATITYFAYGLVSFVIAYISLEKKSINWLINVILMNTMLCCFWVTFYGIEKPGYGKIMGKYSNPNVLGIIMVLGIFSMAYKSSMYQAYSVLFLALSIWPLSIIVGCGSRKSFIASILFIIPWICSFSLHIMRTKKSFSLLFYIGAIVILIGLGTYYIQNIYMNADMATRMEQLEEIDTSSGRVLLYRKAIELFIDNPFFGVGIDQYRYRSGMNLMSHSTYAEMLSDFGFVGSFIYSIPIIQSIVFSLRRLMDGTIRYKSVIVFIFICSELFLGVGQVFFFNAVHFVAWTIIYILLYLEKMDFYLCNNTKELSRTRGKHKYVKD